MLCMRQMASAQISSDFRSILNLHIPLLIEPAIEGIVLDFGINYTLEEETVIIPVESRILVILFDRIVAEDQSVHRFRIQDRSIECFELIILDHDIAMEILFGSFRSGISG